MARFNRSQAHLVGALALVTHSLTPAPALAHGGIARAYEILEEPGNPEHIILRSDLWGFFRSVDGGQTYQYVCAETYGDKSTAAQHRSIVILPGGRILIATQFDGLHVTDDGCSFRKMDAFEGRLLSSLTLHPSDPEAIIASVTVGSAAGVASFLAQSTDRGETWSDLPTSFPADFVLNEVAIAQSQPRYWYSAGGMVGGGGLAVGFSDDGGSTWQLGAVPTTKIGYTARLAAVHPERPEVAFVWVDGQEDLGEDIPDEYWATADGGRTWALLFSGTGDLPGFALSPDHRYVHVAGPLEGIHEAPLDRALAEGPAAFSQIFDRPTWGIRWDGAGVMWIGGNNYTARGIPAYTLGSSTDRGRTQAPEMTVCDIELGACAPGSTVASQCPEVWAGDDQSPGFDEEYLAPRCDRAPAPDGGVPSGNQAIDGSRKITGCTCAMPSSGGGDGAASLALLTLAATFARRRRAGVRAAP